MKRNKFKLGIFTILVASLAGGFVGCSNNTESGSVISVSGSTSIGPLMEKISEDYQGKNTEVSVEINQVGSSAGIKDVINGVSDIGMASRELKDQEKEEVKPTVIAYDGIAVITNENNAISNLTLEQVKDIFTGKITNWSEIDGGKDSPIVVVSREEGSGTRAAFQEIIGYKSEELIGNATISDGNGNIKSTVQGNENAVGFISFEYLDDKVTGIVIDGVKPEADKVKSGEYKISRPFILATKNEGASQDAEGLINYILSDEGQKIVIDNKLIPIK